MLGTTRECWALRDRCSGGVVVVVAPVVVVRGSQRRVRRRRRCPVAVRSRSDSYLVDPASSHMLVSKIKPCMSKHKL
jgi:hypothetical protein